MVILLCWSCITTFSYGQNYSNPQQQPVAHYQQPQQAYSQGGQSQYVSPMQFLPTFGRKFGDMFRRVFYGDAPPSNFSQPVPQYQPSPYQHSGNLDSNPTGGYGQNPPYVPRYNAAPQRGYAPRYETPPPQVEKMPRTPANPTGTDIPPTNKKRNAQGTNKPPVKSSLESGKYTPPAISREPQGKRSEDGAQILKQPTEAQSESSTYRLPGSKPNVKDKSTMPNQPTATVGSGNFLKGRKTGKEGRVISPYPPYRELDVTGLSSGSLALDPTTQKVFEVP